MAEKFTNSHGKKYVVKYFAGNSLSDPFWYISDGENGLYLFADGTAHAGIYNDLGRWGTQAGAQAYLVSQELYWASLTGCDPVATCTCDSFRLFNLGCTCGFLKRAGNG